MGFFGASGAGDDVLLEGPGELGDATGDSVAGSGNASGAGGDDVIDLGEDGGTIAIGDHSASGGTAVGSGNDRIAEEARGSSSSSATVPWGRHRGDRRARCDLRARGRTRRSATTSTRTPGASREWAGDSIDGGAGDDILRGGPNADLLNGNTGRDDCDGEQGTDVEINCEI